MKPIAALAGLLTVASIAMASPPEIPKTPAAVEAVLYARPFTLDEGFKFLWCKEQPNVTTGTLLALEVDKALVVPRAMAMPVLYVGDQSVERVNQGDQSGRLIVVVPGEVDLTKVPVWFGTPGWPWRTDAATGKAERALAEQAGIKPFSQDMVKAARAEGGEPIKTTDKSALLRDQVAELILEYCPDEKHLADGFRLPALTKQKPDKSAEDAN